MALTLARSNETIAAAQVALDLVAAGSLEIGATRPTDARAIADQLPGGTRVFVNHLPRLPLSQSLETLIALRRAGLEAVPHIAARRIESREELRDFLSRASTEAGVSKVLLIGGDIDSPRGPYRDGLALLEEPLLGESGIREVILPSYPEGHSRIPGERLASALAEKLAGAERLGFGATILTQFSFQPSKIIEHVASLRRLHRETGVYVGLAGPVSAASLLRLAQTCGVGTTLRALSREGMRAVDLVMHTDPQDQLAALARYLAASGQSNVVGIHLFSFGNVARTAAWMNAAMRKA